MKRYILFTIFSIFSFFTSCSLKKNNFEDKINICTTIFPIYDWTHNLSYVENKEISNTTLSLMIKNTIDLHSYVPSEIDFNLINKSSLFIYIGGESDAWITELLSKPEYNHVKSLNLTDVINKYNETQNLSKLNDEHIWLSIKYAKICCEAISEKLIELNPEQTELYKKRLDSYLAKLSILDKNYENSLSPLTSKPICICDEFPFINLFMDYELNYISLFETCPYRSEANETKIEFLISKINEYDLKAIGVTESSDKKVAKNIIMSSKNKFGDVYSLDSLQTSSLRDAFNGKTYLGVMEQNLETLKKLMQ